LQFTLFINFGIWDRKILEEVEFNYLLDSCLWSTYKDTRHDTDTRTRLIRGVFVLNSLMQFGGWHLI
jgi:hypothetical protein